MNCLISQTLTNHLIELFDLEHLDIFRAHINKRFLIGQVFRKASESLTNVHAKVSRAFLKTCPIGNRLLMCARKSRGPSSKPISHPMGYTNWIDWLIDWKVFRINWNLIDLNWIVFLLLATQMVWIDLTWIVFCYWQLKWFELI